MFILFSRISLSIRKHYTYTIISHLQCRRLLSSWCNQTNTMFLRYIPINYWRIDFIRLQHLSRRLLLLWFWGNHTNHLSGWTLLSRWDDCIARYRVSLRHL